MSAVLLLLLFAALVIASIAIRANALRHASAVGAKRRRTLLFVALATMAAGAAAPLYGLKVTAEEIAAAAERSGYGGSGQEAVVSGIGATLVPAVLGFFFAVPAFAVAWYCAAVLKRSAGP